MVGGLGVVLAAALAVGAVVFQPWLIFVDTEVDDAIPVAVTPATSAPGQPPPAGPVVISRGSLISHEHSTSGTVSIIEQPDGSRVLAIEDLDTTTGPDVHVWLSQGDVVEGFAGWRTAAGVPHVDLGMIKGNKGNQVYEIPADVELADYPSVFLWCVKFSVSFGAAEMGSLR
ncbi:MULTISPECIES: DM13 domain-containing protein [Gordonia]|uniref:DM13 domain-containing protein n=1 Tax=Gordonia hongkongensis TaxID=1701090 RepID=A0ABT6BU47_9ACTN|nr:MULTISPECIES: DM13 domain-containing protein [Gordonia]MDF6101564.1 DM13 domain-containing protein [Gordonia hongkongensis]OCW84855.1 electron transporter [Nocardia farcinica]WGJ87914.1 DM13 domain-containing protein [Gordonia sp. SMJS1]